MKIHELLEARKNPAKNPKTSMNALLQKYYDQNGEDTFVSFTSVDKLGINPKSKYDTPLGIYAYPLSYVLREIGEYDSPKHVLPFAGDAPFVNVFTVESESVKNLADIDTGEFRTYTGKLKLAFPEHASFVDSAIKSSEHQALNMSGAGRLWYVTKVLAERLSKGTSTKPPVMWNKIFRTIGIDGMVDADGDGIIHHNEPTQAVFFRRVGIVKNEARIYNKYSPDDIEAKERHGKTQKQTANVFATITKTYLSNKKDLVGFCTRLMSSGLFRKGYMPQAVLDELTVHDALLGLFQADIKSGPKVLEHISSVLMNSRGKRWPACEKYLCKKGAVSQAIDYAIYNLQGPFQDAEKTILAYASIPLLYSYISEARKTPWPEAEAKFAKDPDDLTYLKAYRKKFKIGAAK